jgi:hypothetical protein
MSTRATSWLAWSLSALCVVLFLVAVALQIVTLPVRLPSSWGTGGISTPLWAILPFLPFPIVGALIASRRPRNPIGWICLAAGITWMLGMVSGSYVLYGLRMARLSPFPGGGRLTVGVPTPDGFTARLLPDPTVPRWEASFEQVAPRGLVLRGGNRHQHRHRHPRSWSAP